MTDIFRFVVYTLAICFSCSTVAQSQLVGTPISTKSPYESKLDNMLRSYDIYQMDINREALSQNLKGQLKIQLGKRNINLSTYNDNLLVSYKSEVSMPIFLGGSASQGGQVSLTINDNFIYGFVYVGGEQLFIEPLWYLIKEAPRDQYIVYNVSQVIEDKEHVCGVTESDEKIKEYASLRSITECKLMEMAIANTDDMITKYGNVTGATNHNLGVLNNVQTHYRSEFDKNFEFEVIAHYLPTSSAQNPLEPNTSSTDAGVLLSRFRDWAQGPGFAGGGDTGGSTGGFGIDYHIASLWTDRNIQFNGNGGVVGLAYTPGWHNLLEDYTSSAPTIAAMVTHEIGHNFSANHDASGSNYIMAPSVTVTGNWSSVSRTAMNNRLNSQSYLDNCSTAGAPVANFFQESIAVCSGSTIAFEDQSQYGATRTWEFFGGSPSTSTEEKPSVIYNTPGLYAVKLTSTNSAGSDTFFGYVDIESAPTNSCTPSGGNGGNGGINLVSLNNLNNSTTTTGLYDDFSCDYVASVETDTDYDLVVGVENVSRLRYFVDYNNDGDFNDTDEASNMYSFSGNGNLGLTFSTPSSPIEQTILRLRIIVSTVNIGADGCDSPSTGQVEDYGLYFPVAQVLGCTDPTANNHNPNATIDDGSCTTGSSMTWYRDLDGDAYGDPNNTTTATTQPSGYVSDSSDCNDNNANAFPGNNESCDGIDNDCDGQIDENATNTYFADADGDGYGNPASSTQACSTPSGYVSNSSDCDDNNANTFPGNTEICDGIDNDCNGQIDENVTNTYYADADGDGYGNPASSTQACSTPSGYVSNSSDCDDNNANAFPGNTEVCDGIDNDCNGQVDETGNSTFFLDNDGDGYGDSNSSIVDCTPPGGYVTNSADCDDNDANNFPGNIEICDGKDNDCDGQVDENVTNTFYEDNDGDGFGDPSSSLQACSTPSGYVSNNSDCDDNDANVYPGNTEICGDGIDNNCNGQSDEGCGSNSTCDGAILVINHITQSSYHAQVGIISSATVSSASNILFTAGEFIDLQAGFEVIQGTDFEARIESCSSAQAGTISKNGFDDTEEGIAESFNADDNINATIISINDIEQMGGYLKVSDISEFLQTASKSLNKGTYRLVVNDMKKEVTLDIVVIK